jgi:hypothetical protein
MTDGGAGAAWMAGTRAAMTAEAGQSTGIAIRADNLLQKIRNQVKLAS